MNLSKENLDKINFSILRNFSYCWIAGGSITSALLDEEIDDIDIFFPHEKARQEAIKKILCMGAKKVNDQLNDRFHLNGKIYDLICAGENPEETISNFDWTACCATLDAEGNFYCHEKFFDHMGTKQLHFMGNCSSAYQLAFKNKTKRLSKYLEKGYEIEPEMLKYWLSRIISDHNKVKNKRKLKITEINILKFKIDKPE
jgi:hypothetical protein